MIIRLCDIQCYAYHGVLEEEKQKGNTFRVSIDVEVDDPIGIVSDDIHDTIDYRQICDIVHQQMQQPSDLLEHVAWRIRQALILQFPQAKRFTVRVAKQSPPLNLPVAWAEVEI